MNEVGESRLVLASFIKGGSIFNQPLDAIPPNKRFYSGGGGSIRGYAHQLIGPLDSQYIPEGGKSLAEIGTEIRFKTTETTGVVSFIEGGAVTKGLTPEFAKHTLWGAGVGFRYYSPLGPIRVDIAFPLKRRKDLNGRFIDSAFQLYLSVGQAF
jgi:translocation and assembly module TamA